MRKISALIVALILTATCASAETVKLPDPVKSGGMALTEALALRRSDREFSEEGFTIEELSNLLWACAGVNRPDGKLVYPVAMNFHDTSVYVFTDEGVFKYIADSHSLELIDEGDHRKATGMQPFVADAPITLAYVHDANMWGDFKAPKELIQRWGFAHTGAVMQNSGLYCASMGWNNVVRGSFDGENLAKLLKLSEGQTVTLVQTIGKRP